MKTEDELRLRMTQLTELRKKLQAKKDKALVEVARLDNALLGNRQLIQAAAQSLMEAIKRKRLEAMDNNSPD